MSRRDGSRKFKSKTNRKMLSRNNKIKTMTEGISFDNGSNGMKMRGYDRFADANKVTLLNRLLMKMGIAKDESQAKKVSVTIVVTLAVLALIIVFVSLRPPKIKAVRVRAKPVPTQSANAEARASQPAPIGASNSAAADDTHHPAAGLSQ